ncbi:2,3-bisphosphoglycerate-dependent phosphoglycerate mutase [Psilocybe cubensis]|uniref:2,3-bisphosphoglycerate-dependent phosphoglycerate mutase n=2 Tax=Psilocybe cubensis TaxID=181762 RepID=A0ACB8GY81_PSICU|nr:2,3-bisphosphoglycerate-dependent phosphoglycerate mutase [Psilocybe cubensis]KAH9480419.1 2,3-bisphosphoglycerate-dependent phosphoglycerate mutase [Psilocybe cubensis]
MVTFILVRLSLLFYIRIHSISQIRHGESKDNLRQVWAGWKDSPLSNHGMRQAEALADDFCRLNINFDAIYTSDLTRAKLTAKTVKDKQETTAGGATDVPFVELDLLREQSFGAGEGRPFGKKEKGLSLVAHYAKGKFPALHTRQQKFPGGESLDEMALRAEAVIDGVMRLELLKEGAEGKPRTVAVFSHGLFIGELVAAITRRDVEYQGNIDIRDLRGMRNTGWTRLEVSLKPESDHASQSSDIQTYFAVRLNGVNRHGHLSNLHRQKGGIGSSTHDPAQKDIRSFLGGKQKSAPAVSNVIPRPKPY